MCTIANECTVVKEHGIVDAITNSSFAMFRIVHYCSTKLSTIFNETDVSYKIVAVVYHCSLPIHICRESKIHSSTIGCACILAITTAIVFEYGIFDLNSNIACLLMYFCVNTSSNKCMVVNKCTIRERCINVFDANSGG